MGSIKDLGKNLICPLLIMTSLIGIGFKSFGIGSMMLGGLRNINDKIQSTDFARSKNLMDYLDAKSYGGIDARNAAAVANMAQARGIQKQMAQRPSSNVSAQDAARGKYLNLQTLVVLKSWWNVIFRKGFTITNG